MLIIPDGNRIGESLALAREYGLGFEYNDFTVGLDDADAVSEQIKLYQRNRPQSPCTMHGAFYDIAVGSADGRIRAVSRERVRQSVDICRRLGARAVVFHTNTIANLNLPDYTENWLEENARFFSEVLDANRDVNIFIENMFDFTPALLLRLAERLAPHPNFGVCLDYAHACLSPTQSAQWVEALAPYIRHCHLNDCDGRADSHLALGRGTLDIEGFFALLEQNRVRGSVLLEVKGVDRQRESLEYLRARGLPERLWRGGESAGG